MALATYSPDDPNFIFPKNTEIKNILGFQGSFVSDLFFQSVGLIAFLIPVTLIITGFNTLIKKDFFLIIQNIFFTVLYSILGAFFLTHFYSNAFTLYINGNGGFVGFFLENTFLKNIIQINSLIFYYILILLILILFLASINFHPRKFLLSINKFLNFFLKKKKKFILIKLKL